MKYTGTFPERWPACVRRIGSRDVGLSRRAVTLSGCRCELTLDRWWDLDRSAAARYAARAAEHTGGDLVEVQIRQAGRRRGPAALIAVEGTLFSFVPGGPARLGHDAWTFRPTRDELTREPGEVRGSDLGDSYCGAYPWFHRALTRAQAFRDPAVAAIERDRAGVRHRSFRPVIALPSPPAAR